MDVKYVMISGTPKHENIDLLTLSMAFKLITVNAIVSILFSLAPDTITLYVFVIQAFLIIFRFLN